MYFMFLTTNNMKKVCLSICFVLGMGGTLKAQKIMSYTFSSLGNSTLVKNNYFSHVVTQNSVQGTFKMPDGTIVRQGFKQGIGSAFYNKTMPIASNQSLADPILVSVFPNPFADNITLRFENQSLTTTSLELFDLSGNVLLAREYPANTQELTLNNLGGLRIQKYFIRVKQNEQVSTISLLKN